MYRLQVTVLRPQDFGLWGWTEGMDLAGGPVIEESPEDCYAAYEAALQDAQVEYEQTHTLDGLICDQRGRVYKTETGYEMVWTENDNDAA